MLDFNRIQVLISDNLSILVDLLSWLVCDGLLRDDEFTIGMDEGLHLGLRLLLEGMSSTLALLGIVYPSDIVIPIAGIFTVKFFLLTARVWIRFLRNFSKLIILDCVFSWAFVVAIDDWDVHCLPALYGRRLGILGLLLELLSERCIAGWVHEKYWILWDMIQQLLVLIQVWCTCLILLLTVDLKIP